MKIDRDLLGKFQDAATLSAFREAAPDDELQVLLTLDLEDAAQSPAPKTGARTLDERAKVRRSMIEARQSARQDQIQEIIDRLAEHHLRVKGGSRRILRKVVVDGAAGDILKGLGLDGVAGAQLSNTLARRI